MREASDVDTLLSSDTTPYGESDLARDLPLLGVPFTVKEAFSVAGLSHTCGIKSREGTLAEDDADAVRSLRRAGAIPIAVTNVPEVCLWMETNNM